MEKVEEEQIKRLLHHWVFDYIEIIDSKNIDSKYSEAMIFLENKDVISALEIFETFANDEDEIAQCIVGVFYENYSPIKDINKAKKWYEKSMQKEFIPAYGIRGGVELEKVIEVGEEASSAMKKNAYTWLYKAYQHKYYLSIQNLAVCYFAGYYVDKNLDKAIELMHEAIKIVYEDRNSSFFSGYEFYYLGLLYQYNNEPIKAHTYFQKAVELDPRYSLELYDFYRHEIHDEAKENYWKNFAIQNGYEEAIQAMFQSEIEYVKLMEEHQQIEREYRRSSSPCYIVTATMGDENHPRVKIIRDFRDDTLVNYNLGQQFIKWYYVNGSKLAKVVEKSWTLKKLSYYFVVIPISEILKFFKK